MNIIGIIHTHLSEKFRTKMAERRKKQKLQQKLVFSSLQVLEERLVLAPVLWAHDLSSQARLFEVDVISGISKPKVQLPFKLFDIAFDPVGNLYGIDDSRYLYQINTNTGFTDRKGLISNNSENINSLVFSADGKLYGAGNRLYEINPVNGAGTPFPEYLGSGIGSAGDLAFDNFGNLFLSTSSGQLAKINRQTGAATIIGNTGFSGIYGLAFGPDRVLYGMSDSSKEVFSVDTTSGKGTKLSNFANNGINGVGGTTFFGEASKRISIQDVSISEGNTGDSLMQFDVVLSEPTNIPITVNYKTIAGSATEGDDFYGMNVNLTFSPGETLKKAVVSIRGDFDPEPNETFIVSLSNATGALITKAQATGTIVNDDAFLSKGKLQLSSSSYSTNENAQQLTVTILRTDGATGTIGCNIQTTSNSAISGSDFGSLFTTVWFGDGDATPKTITIPIVNDSVVENVEYFNISLSEPIGGAELASPSSATTSIIDDDRFVAPIVEPTARFSLSQYSVKENGVSAKVIIYLSHAYDRDYFIRFRTRQLDSRIRKGIARENIDYSGQNQFLWFKPGETSKTINIRILDDNITEGDEQLGLELIHFSTGRLMNSSKLKIIDTRKPRGWPYK